MRRRKNTPPLPGQPPLPLDFTPQKEEGPAKPYRNWQVYKVWRRQPEPEDYGRWDGDEDEYEEEYDGH